MIDVLFNNIRNERISRVILGVSFSADINSYIDPDSEWGAVDFLSGEKLHFEDCDNGVIRFIDLPEGKNICKLSSLINEGYSGVKLVDGTDLSFPITTNQLIVQVN